MHPSLKSRETASRRRSMTVRTWFGLLVAGCVSALAIPTDARPLTSRRLERPEAQKGLASSSSYVRHDVTLAQAGFVEFDFFVDSEEEHDFFDLEVDGTVKFRASGSSRAGTIKLPLSVGTHQLRFVYAKDAQGNAGLDTAYISRLRVVSGKDVLLNQAFGESPLGPVAGFEPGGDGGGFRVSTTPRKRVFRRPADGALLGYRAGHTVSSAQRSIEWPSGSQQNELLLSYYLDSEESYDYLRVYVDGVERFATSGHDRTGRQRIDVGPAGSHVIEIAYDKDTSVDFGTDDVRILDFQATSQLGTVQLGGFESAELDTLPAGWSTGAHATGGLTFTVGSEPAPRLYAEATSTLVEPDVDGIIGGEYEHQSIAKLPNLASTTGKPGELWLETQTNGKRFLALRVPRGAGGAASLGLFIDQDRLSTLQGKGCGAHGSAPGQSDRALKIEFAATLGDASSISQWQGTCGTGEAAWAAVPENDEWVVEASASEPPEDPGFVHVEVKLVPPSSALNGDWGLGLSYAGGGALAQLPREEGAGPVLDDAASWETIRYAPVTEISRVSFISVDGKPRRGAN